MRSIAADPLPLLGRTLVLPLPKADARLTSSMTCQPA